MSGTYFRNISGNRFGIDVQWENASITSNSVTRFGQWIMIGSGAGQWYENSYTAYAAFYHGSGSDKTASQLGRSEQQMNSGASYGYPDKGYFQLVKHPTEREFYLAHMRNGYTNHGGLTKIYGTGTAAGWSATSFQNVSNNSGHQNMGGSNIGLSLHPSNTVGSRLGLAVIYRPDSSGTMRYFTFDMKQGTTNTPTDSEALSLYSGGSVSFGQGNMCKVINDFDSGKYILMIGYNSGSDHKVYYHYVTDTTSTTNNNANTPQVTGTFVDTNNIAINSASSSGVMPFRKAGDASQWIVFNTGVSSPQNTGNGKPTSWFIGPEAQNAFTNFVGITTESATANNTALVKVAGSTASDLSGLTPAKLAVIDSTTGNILSVNSVGTNQKQIGVTLSATEIQLT